MLQDLLFFGCGAIAGFGIAMFIRADTHEMLLRERDLKIDHLTCALHVANNKIARLKPYKKMYELMED